MKKVRLTVLNTEGDIPLLVDEPVQLVIRDKPFLPVEVRSMEGNMMGYLGLNKPTTQPGTIGSPELVGLLENYDLEQVFVKYHTNHSCQQVVLEVSLMEKEMLVYA